MNDPSRERLSSLFVGVVAGALLALSFPATAAEPAAASGWAAVRFSEAGWQLFSAEELKAEPPSAAGDEAQAAWVWSLSQPPQRVHPGEWRTALVAVRQRSAAAGRPLLAHLAEPCAPRCADLRVVAAPLAMWEQVEEPWLPRWPVADDGRVEVPRRVGELWRVRLLGDGRGGWWQEVGAGEASVLLTPTAATDLPIDVRDAAGAPVAHFVVTLMVDEPSGERPEILARYTGDAEAAVRIPALPRQSRAVFLAMADGHPTRVLAGRGEDLPQPLRLPAGGRIFGRFVDADGRPVAGVEVIAEGWVSPRVPLTTQRTATSDLSGAWSVDALAAGEVVVEGRKEGLRAYRRTVEVVPGDSVDLGSVAVGAGVDLRVAVRGADDEPVAGAAVRRRGSPPAATDRDGVARLIGLGAGERLELHVSAPGFLPTETTFAPPWPDPAVVILRRGLTVTGVYADPNGTPVVDGSVRVETGNSFRDEDLDAGGGFELLLEPAAEHLLALASPSTPETRVRVPPGQAGEHRELGTIQAAPGLVAYGRAVSAADGLPLGGARIWTPRMRQHGSVAAWAFGDVVEATSDAAGEFEVTGLDRKVHELVVEAAGHARRYVEVQPVEGEPAFDVGTVELSVGATVAVEVGTSSAEAAQRLEARLDLRGGWRDLDMLFAPVVDGGAEFVHVPAGRNLLTVLAGHEIVCGKQVDVPVGEERVEVACDGRSDGVAGRVWVGDRPAGPGVLSWQLPPVEGGGAVIFNRSSPRGARQQRAVGVGRTAVRIEVAEDGSFSSDRLAAGRWQVSWRPDGGELFEPRTVEVPAGGFSGLELRYEGSVVSGRVVDEEGESLPGAVVGVVGGGASVMSGGDGGFRIAGVATESIRLQARWRDRYSEVAEVALEPDRPPPPVELRVSRRHNGRVRVSVRTEGGAPAAGAFVFFEADPGTSTRVVSADRDGGAELAYPEPRPARVRAAAHVDGRWVLGDWVPLDEAADGLTLEVPQTGDLALSVDGDGDGGPATLVSDRGWDLARLLTLLGSRPRVAADRPLVVRGLPPGLYTVGLGDRLRTARVERDRETEVELE